MKLARGISNNNLPTENFLEFCTRLKNILIKICDIAEL
jgi:hypothetical protein